MVRRSSRGWGLTMVIVPDGAPATSDQPTTCLLGSSVNVGDVRHQTTADAGCLSSLIGASRQVGIGPSPEGRHAETVAIG